MQSHTGCICLTFHHCVSSNVSSNYLLERMHIRIGCICLSFLRCVSSNVSSNGLPVRMHGHIVVCIYLTFPHYVFQRLMTHTCDCRVIAKICIYWRPSLRVVATLVSQRVTFTLESQTICLLKEAAGIVNLVNLGHAVEPPERYHDLFIYRG